MVLTILAVVPVLALLLVMAAQPLLEQWDARASERDRAVGAARSGGTDGHEVPVSAAPTAFPESLGDAAAALRVPPQRHPLSGAHAAR
ncbi:hypothetical protein [Pseudonocardia parietis]|uniref:TadE-like protein n=1 Tax=Pseudonocardia parietis TaxID=570936 RepID=A0ABS4VPG6_9PSEU|nr:hypothetical protein [Pseudonocardia parietis]MBP2365469.1 hypothetical protein [Pseudonocardia parietis]